MFEILDPKFLISTFGLLGVVIIVFAESGLFFGFFLPGDSLLFTAGLFASMGYFNIWLLLIGTTFAAVLGDNVGYSFGRVAGSAIFNKEDSLFFKKRYVEQAKIFYDRHGPKTIVLARFVPIIRTFAPIVAGVAGMNYRKFFLYNWLGGCLWVVGLTSAGFILGKAVPGIDQYILPIVLIIILLSVLPGLFHIRNRHK